MKPRRSNLIVAWALLWAATLPVSAAQPHPFQPSDVHVIRDVGGMALAPDGEWVAYTVRTTDIEKDKRQSDVYMVSWAGDQTVQLTHSADQSEGSPQFSPDGKYISFVASRGGDGESKKAEHKSQVWLLSRAGGEARRLTALPGGVSSYVWSPDGERLAVVSGDPRPGDVESQDDDGDESAKSKKKPKTKPPIVVTRFQFKRDREGFLEERYDRIYLVDVASGAHTLLTPGAFPSSQPGWSPDSQRLAFVSKRPSDAEPDPDRTPNTDIWVTDAREGAEARRLTTWGGSDSSPLWSPDGAHISYLQGPAAKYDFYGQSQVAILSPEGGTPTLLTAELDRSARNLRWAPDGKSLYFHFADDRDRFIGQVPADGGEILRHSIGGDTLGRGSVAALEVGPKGAVVLAHAPHRPREIYRLDDGLSLTDHNSELRTSIRWNEVRAVDALAEDGLRIGSMLTLPPGYEEGKSYPTIAYIHGGPVGQDGFDFDWMAQAFASAGYVVVQPNYRGSSGRGFDFSRTLFAKWADGVQDIHSALDQLVKDGISDPERLGIGGWSYGGINTNYAIATDTRFAAAVSGSGVANLLAAYGTDQYIRQYENELGPPWEDKALEVYLELSYPFYEAERIKTPTLFMCGEKDFNVPLINSEQMYMALRSLGVPTELVIYPGQYHGLSVPSYVQDRAERMIAWYDKYLKK